MAVWDEYKTRSGLAVVARAATKGEVATCAQTGRMFKAGLDNWFVIFKGRLFVMADREFKATYERQNQGNPGVTEIRQGEI